VRKILLTGILVLIILVAITACSPPSSKMEFDDFAAQLHAKGHFPTIDNEFSSKYYDTEVCRNYLASRLAELISEGREAEIPDTVCGLVQMGYKKDAVNDFYPIYDYNDTLGLKSVKVYHYAFLYNQVENSYVRDVMVSYEGDLGQNIGIGNPVTVKKIMSSYLAFARSFDQPPDQEIIGNFIAEYYPSGKIELETLDLETVYDLSIASFLNSPVNVSRARKLVNDAWKGEYFEITGVNCRQKAASHIAYLDLLYGDLIESSIWQVMAYNMLAAINPGGTISDESYSGEACDAGDSVQYWEHIFSLNHILHNLP